MKIGASTLAVFKYDLYDCLGFYEGNKIEYVELLHDYPLRDMDINILNSFNLKYTIHSPIIDVNICSLNPSIRKASIGEIKHSIDLANSLDVDIVVVHPGKVPFLGQGLEDKIDKLNRNAISEIGKYASDLGVNAVIENMPLIPGFTYTSLEDITNLLEDLDMSMCLDIGHGNTVGYDAIEMYSPLVKHIHVHDNLGDDDSHMSIGDGNVDFKTLLDTYESNNYDGIYMVEVNKIDSIKRSVKKLRDYDKTGKI
ncbi:sugar phosphate isomerase [Methanobrevibacter sp. 87.7]|uniref:sugar phosphate isomerase/epimerase family protein n=1 Tax=Methanobrevibacter sp. 87.7 TaxID=387957 RepID=UPI000B50F790|nr:sugar phosphate isomerase/epimerase family protein [Methanobrevibacter sp. 87.7]OWT33799.1 sugar phosphate isomerase [Methanobrevibacter sp. 87.7]